MSKNDPIADFLRDNSPRPPLPGEVWKFDALEAHVLHGLLKALVGDGLISPDNGTVRPLLESFRVVDYAYGLRESELQHIPGLSITPTEEDIGFFTSLIPMFKMYTELDYIKTEKIRELTGSLSGEDASCACSEDDCRDMDDLPCGHSLRMHLTILEGWYEREILSAENAVASRRALEKVPADQRYTGKQIIARSDIARMIEERVQRDLDNGLYSAELTEELIESIMETGQTRKEAEEVVSRMRKQAEDSARRQLWELAEENLRIIDTEKADDDPPSDE